MKNFIILISKGRNMLKILLFLNYNNIFIKDNLQLTRKLIIKTNLKWVYIIVIKNSDIIYYLNDNLVDFSFLGKDIILENYINLFYKIYNLYFINFNLSIITNKKFIYNKDGIDVSTKYINISNKYFKHKNLFITNYYKANSSTELSLVFDKTNLIVDITSSGRTIAENNLYKIDHFIWLNNILLLNSWLFYSKLIKFFIIRLNLEFNGIIFCKQNRY